MRTLSTNTGRPKELTFNGTTLKTSMIRTSQSKIRVSFSQVIGDEFAGPTIHGTPDCVVYALSAEKYKKWESILNRPMPWGIFGENVTTDDLNENDFKLMDEYQIGSTVLQVTGPRYPCNRLNFVTQIENMREKFRDQSWPGVYFRVLTEGEITPGDHLMLKKRMQTQFSVADVFEALRAAELKEPSRPSFVNLLKSNLLVPPHQKRLQVAFG